MHFSLKFFHFIVSQQFQPGSSGGNGSEENPLNKEIGDEIVWTWIVKNDGEKAATIIDWECDLFPCSSMINLSQDYCAGYTSNTVVREMLH